MTGMDWMYEVQYHPNSDQGSPRTSPHTSPIPIPTLKFVPRPGHEVPWDSPIESPTHEPKNHTYAPQAAHPGFESPWDSPIYTEETSSSSSDTTSTSIPLLMTTATILDATKTPSTPLPSRRHAEEAPWDSPIETPDHPILDHHAPNSHYAHTHIQDMHVSGVSSPTSSAADPGFEVPWDSPIIAGSDSAPMTPFSEIDGSEYFGEDSALHCSGKPLTHPAYRNDIEVSIRGDERVVRQSKPMLKVKVEHPALGMTDGHFAQKQMSARRSEMGCALSDTVTKEEFLWHMYGVCGCGRKAIMTPLRRE